MEGKVFLVEDDMNFGSVLTSYLEMNDFEVQWVQDGANAVNEFKKKAFDICILDVMLPNVDGFTIAGNIKDVKPDQPIIFLTAKTLKEDIIQGFQLGADDYITKPFDSEVLLYKIKAVLKRNSGIIEDDVKEFKLGKYSFNVQLRQLSIDGKDVKLTPKESDLLEMLCNHKNKILDRDKALREIWGQEGYFTTRSMDVYITKLRKYLKDDKSIEIENLHGSGFILHIQ